MKTNYKVILSSSLENYKNGFSFSQYDCDSLAFARKVCRYYYKHGCAEYPDFVAVIVDPEYNLVQVYNRK